MNRLKTQSGDIVSIYIGSQLYRELPLSRDCTIEINNTNTLVIENGYAYMLKADCPDKLCIKQGKISDSSHDIVCLPNKITVRISKHSDIDIISK